MPNCNPAKKPSKPYPEFPLFPHLSGQWAKKINGKVHYFGAWSDPQTALNKFLVERDDLYAGRRPRATQDGGYSVRDVCNRFLTTKKLLLDGGELTPRTFDEYHDTCKRIIDLLGADRQASDLVAEDFEELRRKISRTWGLVRVGNEIQRIRCVFKHAFDHGLLDRPVRYGQAFRKPSKKALRRERASRGKRLFAPTEIVALQAAADPAMRAMILLGINCGFGNNDCGTLTMDALDLKTGWHNHPRPKTGVERRCPLWPETIKALKAAIHRRPTPKDPADETLVFITKRKQRWSKDTRDNPVSKEMAKLLIALKLRRPGISFYALRHTFETIGGETRDQIAVNYIMGHAPSDDDMASVYREQISDERLRAVTDHVHAWLFPPKKAKARSAKRADPPAPSRRTHRDSAKAG